MVDYIIVGFGLAGSAISLVLEEKGRSFTIFENSSRNSSRVAGGIVNPVVLKRFTLAWKAGDHLKEANIFYQKAEEKLGKKFYEDLGIYRKFFSAEEQNNWFNAADKVQLEPFLDTSLVRSVNNAIPSSHSFGKVLGAKRLDTGIYLDTSFDYFDRKGKVMKEKLIYEDLVIKDSYVEYHGIKAKRIIFCEGSGLNDNSFFNYLPLRSNKGEYLIIRSPELRLDAAVKSSVFIIPLGNDLYKVGATYNNSDVSLGITREARNELTEKLDEMIRVSYEIIGQVAGIRPVSADRRPLLGPHPKYDRLYCCNGFGSRGVLASPVLSRELVEFIEGSGMISPEIDISRFKKRWSNLN